MATKSKSKISTDRVVITSFVVDLSDVVISLVIAILTGSVTMIAQTLEGVSDVFSSGFLFVGNRRAKNPPNEKYPYGFGHEIHFWAYMSGLVTLTITATVSIYLGYKRFIHPEPVENLLLAVIGLLFSFMTNGYSTYISYKRLVEDEGLKRSYQKFLNSPLIEVKTAFILDLIGTIASLMGLVALSIYSFTGNLRFDGLGAIATGITLAVFSYYILLGAKELIIGRSAPKSTLKDIEKTVRSFDKVNHIVDFRTLILGSNKLLIALELDVKEGLTTNELEKLIDKIEKSIASVIEWKALIHIELEDKEKPLM